MADKTRLPAALRSAKASDRRAAMKLVGELNAQERTDLLALRASEPDKWVRSAMDRSLRRRDLPDKSFEEPVAFGAVDLEVVNEIREQARGEIAELLVHELRHAAFRIEVAAEKEIAEYRSSSTRQALESLRTLIQSLSQIADTSKGASMVEVSLSDVVAEACGGLAQTLWPPDLIGPPGITVKADPGLLILAISNCVRNALDSSMASAHNSDAVLVTWGKTDRDAWIVILDDGVGISADVESLFLPHHTTKGGSGHAGLGLTIARSALAAMDGQVLLEPRQPRGASCELRWPIGSGE